MSDYQALVCPEVHCWQVNTAVEKSAGPGKTHTVFLFPETRQIPSYDKENPLLTTSLLQ